MEDIISLEVSRKAEKKAKDHHFAKPLCYVTTTDTFPFLWCVWSGGNR